MLRDTGEGGKFSGVFCFVLKENMAWKILKTLKCEKKNGLNVSMVFYFLYLFFKSFIRNLLTFGWPYVSKNFNVFY
jgi:hypothetical protein